MATGESIEVTDRGRLVALLVPCPSDPWKELVASGRVIPAESGEGILEEAPVDYGTDATNELRKMRAEITPALILCF